MRSAHFAAPLAAVALALTPLATSAQEASGGESPSYLFVVSGHSASVKDGAIAIAGAPLVIVFSDRPDRFAGHIAAGDLVTAWQAGSDDFADDPPNAAFLVAEPVESSSIVELTSIEQSGDSLIFDYEVIEGEVPEGELGPASLVIDDLSDLPCITLDGQRVVVIQTIPLILLPCPE